MPAQESIIYTSDATYTGTDTFRYEVCDEGPSSRCASAKVDIPGGAIQLPDPPLPDGPSTTPLNRSAARRMSEK